MLANFQVDILVGWHIDSSQKPSVRVFTSQALLKWHTFWIIDLEFSSGLLKQFMEDAEAFTGLIAYSISSVSFFVKNHGLTWRVNQWPLVGAIIFSSVPPSNSLVPVSALKGFLSWHGALQGPMTCLVHCFRNSRDTRPPSDVVRWAKLKGRSHDIVKVNRIEMS